MQEDSPEVFLHTDEIVDGTDTDHYKEPNAETYSEKLSPTDVNPRNTEYYLRHNLKSNCNDDYRYQKTNLIRYGTRNNYVYHMWILEKCYGTLTDHLRTYPQNSE